LGSPGFEQAAGVSEEDFTSRIKEARIHSQSRTDEKYLRNGIYWSYRNINHAATVVKNGNLSFEGASGGTTLRAFNRMTTLMFFDGWTNGPTSGSGMQNILFTNLTFKGRPELTAGNVADPDGYGIVARWTTTNLNDDHWEFGTGREAGDMIVFRGNSFPGFEGQQIKNIEFANCTFWNPAARDVHISGCRDVEIQNCSFLDDRTDRKLGSHLPVFSDWTCHYTTNDTEFIKDNTYRLSLHDNIFYGGGPNTAGQTMSDGIFWGTRGGGFHVADNAINNYTLEGVQINAGPATVVRNNFKTDATNAPVAFVVYQTRVTSQMTNGVDGVPAPDGLTSEMSPYAMFSFVDNSVQGGLGLVKALSYPVTNNPAVPLFTAASDYIVSGNTIKLMAQSSVDAGNASTCMNFYQARNVMFAGNQVINAMRGLQYGADWYETDTNHHPVPYICKLTVMCNDFTGLTGHVEFDQGTFPVVDYLKFYANKMGGTQTIHSESTYYTSYSNHTPPSTKTRLAIVGNSYSGDPAITEALVADFLSGNFTSIQLFKLDLTIATGITLDHKIFLNTAPLFSDPSLWSLY